MKNKGLLTLIIIALIGFGVFSYVTHGKKSQPNNMQQEVTIAANNITVLSAANRKEIASWITKHQLDNNAVLLTHEVQNGIEHWVMYVKDPKTDKFVAREIANNSALYTLLKKDDIAKLADGSKLIEVSDTKTEAQLAKATSDYANSVKVPAPSTKVNQSENTVVVAPATTITAKTPTHSYVANPVRMYAARKAAMAKPITVPMLINKKVQIGGEYSDEFGSILDTKFAYQFNHMFALAAEGDIGAKEYRVGGTVGFMPTSMQLLKVTFEHLAQKIKFDFVTGSDREWIGQNAGGASYDYFFKTNRHYLTLNSLGVSGYYSKADSKNLDTKSFNVAGPNYIVSYLDYRHIAGGQAEGVQATASFTPWIMSVIKVGAGYDAVKYDMKYSKDKDSAGVGGTVDFEQLIGRQIKVDLSADLLKAYDDYTGTVSYLFHTRPGTHLEVAVKGSHITDRIASTRDNRVGLDLSYAWGGTGAKFTGYTLPQEELNASNNLLAEVMNPAVHMSKVLALKDEKIVAEVTPGPHPGPTPSNPTSNPISSFWGAFGQAIDFNAAKAGDFNANGGVLKYSLKLASGSGAKEDTEIGLKINPTTGVITSIGAVNAKERDTVVTVVADKYVDGVKAGSTSESFTIYLPPTGADLGTTDVEQGIPVEIATANKFNSHGNANVTYKLVESPSYETWTINSKTGEVRDPNIFLLPPGTVESYKVEAVKNIPGLGEKTVTETGRVKTTGV